MADDENYTPADYLVSTMDAPKGKYVGVIVNAVTKAVLHGCRHKHDDKRAAKDCIRAMTRTNGWKINIVN
jgi:hypothetical protein